MKLLRVTKVTIMRHLLIPFGRGDFSCVTATIGIIVFLFLIMTVVTNHKAPTVLTILDDMKLDLQSLQKDTLNTVLLEQDNGESYIAFKLKPAAHILNVIQQSRVEIKDPTLFYTKTPTPVQTTDGTGLGNNKNKAGINSVQEKNSSRSDPVPTYPVTAFKDPYILNSAKVCTGQTKLSFLVIVHTATTHFMRRSSIRETWANHHLFHNHSMRIVFLLGKASKESTQLLIEHEQKIYKDIVQGDFVDSYRNLTHKGVMGYRWIKDFCPQARFIVKVDDDVFVNVFKLLDHFESDARNKTKHVWCQVRPKGTSLIQRDSGKWKVDEHEFKNMSHYPVPYCNGYFVVMTGDMMGELFEAAKSTPFFWVDDVYLYGLLPDKVGGVTFKSMPNLNLNENDAKKCFESREKPCNMLVANAHSDGVMDQLWFRALDQYKTLAKKYSKDTLFLKAD